MFGFNILPEAIVGPIIMLGARWIVMGQYILHLKIAKHVY